MEMTGEYRIPAKREAVWAALNDPAILKECIPGCEALTGNAEDGMSATVTAKVGPVEATFVGDMAFSNVVPPESYTIQGEGKGGEAGFAKGGADVRLGDAGEETVLSYKLRAHVGGKLAQLGSRLIDTTAKKMADEFFGALAARVGNGAEPTISAPSLATPGGEEAAEDELIDRLEHRVEDFSEDVADAAVEAEQELEVAAGRGVLGGPYVWGLLALLAMIVALALLTR